LIFVVDDVALGKMCPSTAVSRAIIVPPLPYSSSPNDYFHEDKVANPWDFQSKQCSF